MTAEQLEWVSLSDFSKGIVHNLAYSGIGGALTGFGPGAAGMATMDGTWRCIALPGGGLGPLPRREANYAFGCTNAASMPAPGQLMATSVNVIAPMSFMLTSIAGSTNQELYHSMDPRASGVGGIGVLYGLEWVTGGNRKTAVFYHGPSMGTDSILSSVGLSSAADRLSDASRFGWWSWAQTRLRAAGAGTNGSPVVVGSWSELISTSDNQPNTDSRFFNYAFPNLTGDHAFGGAFGVAMPTLTAGGTVIGHQGRVVYNSWRLPTGHFYMPATDDYEWWRNHEYLYWTLPAEATLSQASSASSAAAIFGAEQPTGYGVMASVSAGELLLIKHDGGAFMVQGDLDYPTVRRLAGVPGTQGAEVVPAQGSLGVVYGVNRGGVYAWQGGDGAVNLSPQLPPDFWMGTESDYITDHKGTFCSWGNRVITPGNWVFDGDMQSWWRLEDPASFWGFTWQRHPTRGHILGAPATATTSGDGLPGLVQVWDPSVGHRSYRWTSQPMFIQNPDRRTKVREAVLVAQGQGTVTVTIYGESTTEVVVFTLAGSTTQPQMQRKSLNTRGLGNFQVRIEADSGSASVSAPVVYELRVGHRPDHIVGRG